MSFLQISDWLQLVADSFLNGSVEVAAMCLFVIVVAAVFILMKSVFQSLVVGILVAMIFRALDVLSSELMVMIILISILGLAATAKKVSD